MVEYNYTQAKKWLLTHGTLKAERTDGPYRKSARIVLHTDLKAFKTLCGPNGSYQKCIANVIIPAGNTVVLSGGVSSHKVRTGSMDIHSIVNTRNRKQYETGRSYIQSQYYGLTYRVGKRAKSAYPLDKDLKATCTSGLYFFVDVTSALMY